jgi:hypothetical protein
MKEDQGRKRSVRRDISENEQKWERGPRSKSVLNGPFMYLDHFHLHYRFYFQTANQLMILGINRRSKLQGQLFC